MKKQTIRIPFSKNEYERIENNCAIVHLKKATYITTLLLFSLPKVDVVKLSFHDEQERENDHYIQIYVDDEVYEKIKKYSRNTRMAIPNICRYLILPNLILKENDEYGILPGFDHISASNSYCN